MPSVETIIRFIRVYYTKTLQQIHAWYEGGGEREKGGVGEGKAVVCDTDAKVIS